MWVVLQVDNLCRCWVFGCSVTRQVYGTMKITMRKLPVRVLAVSEDDTVSNKRVKEQRNEENREKEIAVHKNCLPELSAAQHN